MFDVIFPLQNFTDECYQFRLSIYKSPIEALRGEFLENISLVSLNLYNMENLNYIYMKIFSASYKTSREFRRTVLVENVVQIL
jgi:hypothetical protein